jgi:hypothetical protein
MTGLWRAAATDMADASARSRLPSPFFASTITYFLRLLLRSSSAAKTPSVVPPECSPACLLAPAPSPPPPPPPSSSLPPPPATPPLLDSSTVSDSSDCIIRDPMIISSSRSSKRRRGTLSLTEAVRSEWKGVVLFVRSTVASSSKGIPGCASPAARSPCRAGEGATSGRLQDKQILSQYLPAHGRRAPLTGLPPRLPLARKARRRAGAPAATPRSLGPANSLSAEFGRAGGRARPDKHVSAVRLAEHARFIACSATILIAAFAPAAHRQHTVRNNYRI